MFKWLAAFLGFQILGYSGAILGFFIGSTIDRTLRLGIGAVNPLSSQHRQDAFLKTIFTLMGKLAKADGHISQAEIDHVENFMVQMGMTPEHKKQAIEFFKVGSASDFDIKPLMDEFISVCGRTRNLSQVLLSYLLGVALADGVFDSSEEKLVREIALTLGFSSSQFDQLIYMIRNQNHFAGGQAASTSASEDAYAALGVSAEDTDPQIKRAYRSLMSKYHPDKLIGQGMPEDMIKGATERSQEIQGAYDLIKKSRQT